MRLAIITTHPIQYYSPVFRLLHEHNKIEINVFYTWGELSIKKYDPGFDKKIEWDIPLLDGYPYEWVQNSSPDPGTHHFKGIINPGIIKQVNNWHPDAILIYGWGFDSHIKVLRYFKKKIPVFFRGDSTLLDEKKDIKSVLKSVFLKWVYKYTDYAFYVGTNNKAYFKKYGLKENQLIFAPHAIDNFRFEVSREYEANLLRLGLQVKDNELLFMFAGKLEEKKAPVQLLTAFLNLNKPGVHLLFVGNGPLEKQLKFDARDNANVHFLDFQNQSRMPVVYQACDVFCLPSRGPFESWGLATNEAMACGKAILASDKVGAAVDLVKPNYNGIIFKGGDLADLVINLNLLINYGKDGLSKMGSNSKELIKAWSLEAQVQIIESVIKSS